MRAHQGAHSTYTHYVVPSSSCRSRGRVRAHAWPSLDARDLLAAAQACSTESCGSRSRDRGKAARECKVGWEQAEEGKSECRELVVPGCRIGKLCRSREGGGSPPARGSLLPSVFRTCVCTRAVSDTGASRWRTRSCLQGVIQPLGVVW